VLINSRRSFDELGVGEIAARYRRERLCTVAATEIALRHLGRPVPSAVLLGGFAALSEQVTLAAVTHAIRSRFSGAVADGNVAAAAEAFAHVRRELAERADA
jgi:pyruvate ferredoxin oxidoreductase gamma subunit